MSWMLRAVLIYFLISTIHKVWSLDLRKSWLLSDWRHEYQTAPMSILSTCSKVSNLSNWSGLIRPTLPRAHINHVNQFPWWLHGMTKLLGGAGCINWMIMCFGSIFILRIIPVFIPTWLSPPAKNKKLFNVNVILINYPVYAIYKRIRRHLMWIKRLCAKLGERGRHTFVFLFQPFGESSRNRATYLQSRGI